MGAENALNLMHQAIQEGEPFAVALLPYGVSEETLLAIAIQSDSSLRQTNLIAVTELDDATDTATIKQAGFCARLYRPLLQSRLFDAIASATVNRSGHATPAAPASPGGQDLLKLKGLHLLVAEDNEMNQFVTEETLKRAGCTCEIVGDGILAVEAVQKGKYDGILMDCQMPGMDGLTASRHIRERETATPGSRRIPIIALTAEAVQGDREKCLAAGMDGYVSKPINAEELFSAIATLVAPQHTTRAGKPASSPEATIAVAKEAQTPIDVEELFSRCMRDTEFATQTLEKFQRRALDDLDLLRRGVAAGDAEGTTRLAHNLKAISAHVAAGALNRIAFEIEQAGSRHDLGFIEEQLERLGVEARRCSAFVPEAISRISRMPGSATAPIQVK